MFQQRRGEGSDHLPAPLNHSWPSPPAPGRPNYPHFRLNIEIPGVVLVFFFVGKEGRSEWCSERAELKLQRGPAGENSSRKFPEHLPRSQLEHSTLSVPSRDFPNVALIRN